MGWIIGLLALARLVVRDSGKTWHATGCFVALSAGAVGVCLWIAYLSAGDETFADISTKIGTFGSLAPVYFTVAHRMIPFFSASALPGYAPWRPYWVLAARVGLSSAERWGGKDGV